MPTTGAIARSVCIYGPAGEAVKPGLEQVDLTVLGQHAAAHGLHLLLELTDAQQVVVGDQASEQEALAAIYSSEESAAEIDRWLRANCAVDIGPVFTIVPHTPVTAPPPTTVP